MSFLLHKYEIKQMYFKCILMYFKLSRSWLLLS